MSLFIGNNKSRLNYSPSSYQQGISNYPFLVYQANIDASNPPSPWSEQWKQITESSLINKIRELNGLNETIETQLVDFTNGIYNHNSPANGTMSVRIDGNTMLDNPDAPTKMTSVGEEITLSNGEKCHKIEVLSTGSNLLDYTKIQKRNESTVIEFVENGFKITDQYFAYILLKLPKKTNFYLSAIRENNAPRGGAITIYSSNSNADNLVNIKSLSTANGTFNTLDSDYIKILFYTSDGTTATQTFKNIKLEVGTTQTTYTPYQKVDKTEILLKEGLRKVDTAIDKRYSDGKVWRETKEIELKNYLSYGMLRYGASLNFTNACVWYPVYNFNDKNDSLISLSNKFKNKPNGWDIDSSGTFSFATNKRIYFNMPNNITTETLAKKYIEDNNVKIQYQLLNPNYEHLLSFIRCLPNGVSDTVVEGDGIWEVSTGVKSIKGEIYLKSNVCVKLYNGGASEQWFLNNTKEKTCVFGTHIREYVSQSQNYYTENYAINYGIEGDIEKITCVGYVIYVCILKTKADTIEKWKSYLSNNPMNFYYQTTQPTYRVLTAEEKTEYNAKKPYLDKMLVLNSFKGGNLVINSGEVSPSGKLMYTTDVKDENILVMSCGEVGKSKAIVCRVSLKELMNSLYGGSFTALKTAIQRLAGVSYSDKSKLYYWNGTQYVLLGENTNTSIKEIKATFDKSVLTDENIALMLVSSTPATSTVPSVLSLDHIKLECDITRTPETIDLGNDSVVTLPSTWSILCKGVAFDTVTNGNIIQIGSHIVNIPIVDIPTDRFKATNILIQQQNGVLTTCILKQPNDNISINQEDKTILGANRISLMNGDFFEDSIHYFPNKVWSLNEVKILLTGKIPTGFENTSEMIALKNSAKNPNLLPQSVFNNVSIRRLDGETVINGNSDIVTLEANKNKSYDIVILPNNVYELSVQSLQYPLVIDEYCGNYLIKSEICKVDNTKKVGLFKTNSNTNMIRLRFNSADFNPPAK